MELVMRVFPVFMVSELPALEERILFMLGVWSVFLYNFNAFIT